MSFSSQVKKITANVKDDADKLVRSTLLAIYRDTIIGTPVLTGRLRNNWFTSLGEASIEEKDGTGTESSPESSSRAISSAVSTVGQLDHTRPIYFANNLPYAMITEFGGTVNGKVRSGNRMLNRAIDVHMRRFR